ncbi:MAG: filamentous hemagglutinin N-terminal domain-containing protein, partial [Alphaproteobacteria bacterium]|nr:filamentous hemagglutinin N-terminal domain-containing protein [Alphaproteobacteria bacterium]
MGFSKGKNNHIGKSRVRTYALATTGLITFMMLAAAPLAAQPVGPSLVAGQAQVSSFGATTYVNQSTNKAIINWQDFSVSAGSAVQFNQPSSSSITLNRVTGSGISNIDGSIRSNGQVWLLNPNGLLFGSGASINVGGLLAATSDIANRDFEDGRYNFAGGRGGIVNNGVIKASNGGSVILSAPSVTNRGLIQASAGHVVLGGTDTFTVDFNGDHLLSYAVGANSSGGSVTNTGKISTPGGRVLLTARAASDVRDAVINNTGMIEATSVREERGEIILEAEGGGVSNSGTIDVSGKVAGEVGGTVKVLGNAVAIEDGANIDASGHAGGGTVLIGGNSRGEGLEINAQSTRVGNAAINASAIATGNGGKVVVYSTGNATVSGSITAKGGAVSGNGGAIETSGHFLSLSGISVDAGLGGDWLLDPFDLTVTTGDAVAINNTLNAGTNVSLQTSATGASEAATRNSSGLGDIYIEAPISWSSAANLKLSAYRDINFNASITISGAGSLSIVTANAGNNIGDYRIKVGEKIQFTSTTRAKNSNGRSLGLSIGTGLISGGLLSVNSKEFQICNSAATCTTNLDSSGNITNLDRLGNYALGISLDVAGMGAPELSFDTHTTPFAGIYEGLGNTISNITLGGAGGIFNYSDGVIRDIGLINVSITSGSTTYVIGGLVNHNGGKILNSTISLASGFSPNSIYIGGLVGENTSTGQIINSSATGFIRAVYTGGLVGGLVAVNSGLIKDSKSYVQVTHSSAPYWSGGLVGWNSLGATIQNSLAAGSVYATSSMNVGGLAGGSEGLIKDSSSTATMDVRNGVSVGGLVGYTASTSSIQGSSASGTFTLGANSVGGLVGEGLGSIDNSWTAGIFDFSPSPSNANAGGLVGNLSGVITNSYSSANLGSTTVVRSIGGLVGAVASGGIISGSHSVVSIVSPAGYVGGLVGLNNGFVKNSWSASDLKYTGSSATDVGLGGLVGKNSAGSRIETSFSAGLIFLDGNDISYLTTPIGSSYSAGGLVGSNDGSIENT